MIKCIAIEDEPLALMQIKEYIIKTPFLELIKGFDNALAASKTINETEIDLIFTDINMPDINGMDFIKSLEKPPKVIFTTAYEEYALEGYKVNAIDYLLKPIGYSDFLKAANKAKTLLESTPIEPTSDDQFLFIKSEYKIVRINFSEIKHIEGMREYVRIHLVNKKPIMSLMSMKKIEEHLPEKQFMRVHRSHIVNLHKITTVEKSRIIFDEEVYIPISDQYKERFQSYMDQYFL